MKTEQPKYQVEETIFEKKWAIVRVGESRRHEIISFQRWTLAVALAAQLNAFDELDTSFDDLDSSEDLS